MKKDLIRVAAKEKGERYYVPEKPCAKGHYIRATSSGSCIECRKAREKRQYYADPEKTKARTKHKYAKNAEMLRAKRRLAHAMTKDDPKVKAQACERAKRWRELNPNNENAKASKKVWKLNNPHKVSALSVKRRISEIQRTPKWLSEEDNWLIEEIYALAILRTKLHGFSWHVDHIIPLQGKLVSGLHVPKNLQVIPWLDNIKKANKHLPV